jgi:hypothetical protein
MSYEPAPVPAYAPFEQLKAPDGTKTGTVWIWLIVLLPILSVLSIFAIDFRAYFTSVMEDPTSMSAMLGLYTSPAFLLITLGSWVLIAATIVFAFLDWRELKRRGVPAPFHWAFAFLGIAGFGIVYPIGRSVVVKKRTGQGLAPLWATIAVFVISVVVIVVWSVMLMNQVLAMMPAYVYS